MAYRIRELLRFKLSRWRELPSVTEDLIPSTEGKRGLM